MMKLTFELVAANDINTFNELVNAMLTKGYRFMANMPVSIVNDVSNPGMQYSIAMLLEEEA